MMPARQIATAFSTASMSLPATLRTLGNRARHRLWCMRALIDQAF
jgi:hypothetical protein